uniref:Cyclic nucleotide-binding domain-containing protein n=1 Tax=Macrostomum lignano TaxID=282301 RepID=A0A1I8HCG8_9PLAT
MQRQQQNLQSRLVGILASFLPRQIADKAAEALLADDASESLFVGAGAILILTSSVKPSFTSTTARQNQRLPSGTPDWMVAEVSGSGKIVCFHCGAACPGSSSLAEADSWSRHRQASPGCYLQRLAHRLVLTPQTRRSALDAGELSKLQRSLTRLGQVLDSPVLSRAASFGIQQQKLDFCAARYFMRHQGAAVNRPGDAIQLVHSGEEEFEDSATLMEQVNVRELLQLSLNREESRTAGPASNP